MTAMLLQFAPHEVRRSKKLAETYINTHQNLVGFVEAQKRRRDDALIDAGMEELGNAFEAAIIADEMCTLLGLGSLRGERS